MTEIYLRLVDLILTPIIMLIAIMLFLRGHDLPGGGFIAGLVFASAIELTILARGAEATRARYGPWLVPLVGLGLSAAVTAGLIGIYGGGFFRSMWIEFYLGAEKVKFGTPQLFDLGVMLVVIGMAITYLSRLSETAELAIRENQSEEGGQS
ncbi:MnhB domain-containing protein [Caldilinea sp.]|uniref:MnhB domain-containing protein n=1 Tax=Caldilinea sp. TaxID=2293560 RepID=UPI002B79CE5E|nr:MnhB domain-containing protein [Anaerolineales bacterium]HQY90382.1 MnhB domain-containing protein [Caldilinea sp.]HRA66994.1 MnhB domain-containing protein [Caldilinea sp.]